MGGKGGSIAAVFLQAEAPKAHLPQLPGFARGDWECARTRGSKKHASRAAYFIMNGT